MEVLETTAHWLMNGGELLRERAINARDLGKPEAAYEVAKALWAAAERSLASATGSRGTGRLRLIDLLSRNQILLDEDPGSRPE